jgi:thiol-disulfide isomerase/thioredoxin
MPVGQDTTMTKQKFIAIFLVLALAAFALGTQAAPLPRKSPEFSIIEPSGKTSMLSGFKGKVVVMEFLFIRSEHCLRVAQMLNRLNTELAPRGFQSVGIVFDPPNDRGFDPNTGSQSVTAMVNYFKLTYPVGYTSKDKVDSYLGRASNEVLNIPQVVVIDRGGVIRAASGGKGGNPRLENEDSLRALLDTLLKETVTTGMPVKAGPPRGGTRP